MAQDFWSACGFRTLTRNDHGWLRMTPDYLRHWLERPELAPVEDSGPIERALHRRLIDDPLAAVAETESRAIEDTDARENYEHFLRFRKLLADAVTLERFYLQTFRRAEAQGAIDLPPVFMDQVAQTIVRSLLEGCDDPYRVRAGELFFRRQRVSSEGGQWLSADAETIQVFAETGGFGSVGRLMASQGTALRGLNMDVLSHESAQLFWLSCDRHSWLLDLTPGREGLDALAALMAAWVRHFFGAEVEIAVQTRIDDERWRWHSGLDVESSALLNALYARDAVDEARRERLISLFRLTFGDAADMRKDVAGVPVYLGLAVTEDRQLKMKPQNLLLNLPLARIS
jgi:Family of unknown function (DUF6352)